MDSFKASIPAHKQSKLPLHSRTSDDRHGDPSMDLSSIKVGLAHASRNMGAGALDVNVDAKISEAESSQATSSSTTLSNAKPSQSSSKSSVSKSSTSSEESDISNDSLYTSFITALSKPHKGNDVRWTAIQAAHVKEGALTFNHFRLLKKLGCGDIGSVYLAELRGNSNCYFAMKVMDKGSLASRKKLLRAQTEREILQCLDHPFLPTLYTHFDTDKFSCLLMEFCSGGDLHMLRQRQPGKHFTEMAAKFYAAEVLLALEYLHMMGVIYRDLKPENVLVREDGHIMLSDFDLSLRCVTSPTLVKSSAADVDPSKGSAYCVQPACLEPTACAGPACIQPTCFMPKFIHPFRSKTKNKSKKSKKNELGNQVRPLPELIAEPTAARSLSFVGTHEYLAPEIIKGEGHGSAVDWWTFGIFLYELLHGKTPFKGAGNRATLFNVIGQSLKFPEAPSISYQARDLIRGLLVKDPQHRLAYKRGATEIKQHPFFEGVNWALIRSMSPPQVPKPFQLDVTSSKAPSSLAVGDSKPVEGDAKPPGTYLDFEFF
ncbi:hypothetical protein KP509_36G030200 [Ceratopteris richardii]|uniref:non-specific serine/threonine protein kinase n=1 Tax=Ceratopteris richardii TaxID=49495 RepID=A0A8T2QAH8_CERRI|nr:hypothetical protein KP509_36G030200 [Ceratopteris richardii]